MIARALTHRMAGRPITAATRPVAASSRKTHVPELIRHGSDEDQWVAAISLLPTISLMRVLYAAMIKRSIDMIAACTLMVLLSPLLLLTILAVRLDTSGGAIFRQTRVGLSGRRFTLYKFRTMQDNPSGTIAWIVDKDGQKRHKVRNDPRITRVGRWLRRTSIDELPQLINVIKGEMSLIGPRPELPDIVDQYEPWQHDRHLVRPGLTGWWQVSGRSDLPMHENTELDIFYVRRMAFRLDVMIGLKTIRVVLRGLGAF